MSKKISVIVPIYNVENYLADCIDSICNQSYTEMEIILINDGSTDSGGKICKEYAQRDSRIIVIEQKNQGLSQARNAGLKIATGEYFFFVDSDDLLHRDILQMLYQQIKETSAEISICGYEEFYKTDECKEKININFPQKIENNIIKREEIMDLYFVQPDIKYVVVWNKLFHRKLFKNIEFPAGRGAEDEAVMYKLLYSANYIAMLEYPLYFYRQRENSLMRPENVQKYLDAMIIFKERKCYFESIGEERYQWLSWYRAMYWNMRFFYATWERNALVAQQLKQCFDKGYPELKKHMPIEADSSIIEEMELFYQSPEENDIFLEKKKYKSYKRKIGFFRVKMREAKHFIKDWKYIVKTKLLFGKIRFGKQVKILNIEESIKVLLEGKKGLVRFGDGELNIMHGAHTNFQIANVELGKKLEEIIRDTSGICYIGVLDEINLIDYSRQSEESQRYWIRHIYRERENWVKYLDKNITYLTANVTRPYMRYRTKVHTIQYFKGLRKLWEQKDIMIIEGAGSRLGIGNDLFDNAKSIQRIICPAENAYDVYDSILSEAKKIPVNIPIFLALGPTATVLGYELCKLGYLAYDIGHVDVEYEWMRLGTTQKVAVKNKYTNEVDGGNQISSCTDEVYLSQIIARIQ